MGINKYKQVHFQLGRYFDFDGNVSVKITLITENIDTSQRKKKTMAEIPG